MSYVYTRFKINFFLVLKNIYKTTLSITNWTTGTHNIKNINKFVANQFYTKYITENSESITLETSNFGRLYLLKF